VYYCVVFCGVGDTVRWFLEALIEDEKIVRFEEIQE